MDPNEPESFDDLIRQSCGLIAQRSITEAGQALSRAADVALQIHGENSPRYRASIDLLRVLREYNGDVPAATLQEKYQLQEKGLSLIQARDRQKQEALSNARFAYSAEDRNVYIGLIGGFGSAAWNGSRFELARQFVLAGFDLWRWDATEAKDWARLAETIDNLGRISLNAGAFGPAYLLFEEVRRLCAAGDVGYPWTFAALAGLGRTWLGLGERETGQELLRQAIQEAREPKPTGWRDGVRDLYQSYLDSGKFEEASQCHEALAYSGDTRGTSSEEIAARKLENTDTVQAAALYRQILNPEPGIVLPSSLVMRVSIRLMRLLLAQGSLKEAYSLLGSVYPIFLEVKGEGHPEMSEVEEIAAELECALGRPETALHTLFRATARDSRVAPLQLSVGSPAVRNRLLAAMRRRTEAAVGLVAANFRDHTNYIGGVFALINRRKGLNVNIEWQKLRQLTSAAAHAAEARAVQAQLSDVRLRLARTALKSSVRTPEEQSSISALLREKEDLDNRASFVVGGVAVEALTEQPNPSSISMCIPEDAAYIEFVNYQPLPGPGGAPLPARYCAIVVRARYMQWSLADLGEASEVDSLIKQFRASITGGLVPRSLGASPDAEQEEQEGPRAPGHLLRQLLIDSLLPLIEGKTRLVICPDSILFSLPFESLPTEAGGNLIDLYRINYVFSSRDVMYFDSDVIHGPGQAASCSAPLVMGSPDYNFPNPSGGVSQFRFAPLPGTQQEAEKVAALLKVPHLLERDASRANLERAHSPLILHLATHGFTLPSDTAGGDLADMPLVRCGIALAGANSPESSGIVTAEEALSLDLNHTALAVLSACETGIGFAEHGEGLASLGRAFATAGASAVVIGLWKVPDQNTRALMEFFYANLAQGISCADSLHNAKLAVRKNNPNVYDWGAFVCVGRWGSIAVESYSKVASVV